MSRLVPCCSKCFATLVWHCQLTSSISEFYSLSVVVAYSMICCRLLLSKRAILIHLSGSWKKEPRVANLMHDRYRREYATQGKHGAALCHPCTLAPPTFQGASFYVAGSQMPIKLAIDQADEQIWEHAHACYTFSLAIVLFYACTCYQHQKQVTLF